MEWPSRAARPRHLARPCTVASALALALLALPLRHTAAEAVARQPKAPDRSGPPGSAGESQPASVARVIRGLSASMRESGDAFRKGEHLRGVDALNNARRAADFAAKAAAGALDEIAAAGRDTVERARNALQNGDADMAGDLLRRGSSALAAALDKVGSAGGSGSSAARTGTVEELSGARLINAKGVPIGMVSWFAADQNGDLRVGLRIGGLVGFAGFVNVGGTEVVVPISQVVLGKGKVALASDAGKDGLAGAGHTAMGR